MGNPQAPTPQQTPYQGTTKQPYAPSDSGSGDRFPSLLPIAIQVAAKTIGFDLVNVIPMDSPVGFLPYLDYVYAGGLTDSQYPAYTIKFTRIKPDTKSVGSPNKVLGEYNEGDTFHIATDQSPQQVLVDLKWIGFSRVDGHALFEVKKLHDSNAASIQEAVDNGHLYHHTGSGYDAEWDLSSSTVDLVSALENHVSGYTGAGHDNNQDFNGPFLNENFDSNGALNEPGNMSRETGEMAKYRQMGLQLMTKWVEAGTDQVSISATVEQIQDLNRVWNMDVISMLENVGVNDIAQKINKLLVSRIMELGYKHSQDVHAVEGADITNLDLAAGTGGFENTNTLQRRVATKVLEMANLIYHRSRWGAGNYVVTNGRIASALADSQGNAMFQYPSNMGKGAGQLYPAGDVQGLTIYVDPNLKWGDSKLTIGRKGDDQEPGVKFLPWIMAESLQTIAEGTFSPKIGIKSRYAITEAGWHPETQYLNVDVSNVNVLTASYAPGNTP
jgi:hypothetical protein